MRIFISYSSKYRDICDRLQLALEANGRHEVFVDRSELTPGLPFDETLRGGIKDCELLVFLLSPESVAPQSYALAELSLAKQRWRHPGGHVLPVKVAPVPKDAIPAYLRAVTILEPLGDVVAETVAAVDAVRPPSRRGRLWALFGAAIVIAGVLGVMGTQHVQRQRADLARAAEQQRVAEAQVTALGAAARQLCESGDPALAWQRYDEALAKYAERPTVRQAREDCGMRWLREIHVVSGKETFTDIVNRVLPVLTQGVVSASGQRAADLYAHMGWADHLRAREGAIRRDPPAYYGKALAADPSNVFAHAMWGHNIMAASGPIADAKQHFTAALASGRERSFVRTLQFAAMLYHLDPAGQVEAARVANAMREAGEPIGQDTRDRLWTYVYYSTLLSRERRAAFVTGLGAEAQSPAHRLTFAWLFPEATVRPDQRALWQFFAATLAEAAGDRTAARRQFESLQSSFARDRSSGTVVDETLLAIKRLQRP